MIHEGKLNGALNRPFFSRFHSPWFLPTYLSPQSRDIRNRLPIVAYRLPPYSFLATIRPVSRRVIPRLAALRVFFLLYPSIGLSISLVYSPSLLSVSACQLLLSSLSFPLTDPILSALPPPLADRAPPACWVLHSGDSSKFSHLSCRERQTEFA